MDTDLISYYNARANEYERIYQKPERQHDLTVAATILQEIFSGKDVFEIACGTGYWTEIIAKTAHCLLATDINQSVIEVAKAKQYSPAKVTFKTIDLFSITGHRKYQSLFGGFIWSHIKLQDLAHFIEAVDSRLESGGTVVLMDNNYIEGSSTKIIEIDEAGNTYQARMLDDGTVHKVLKNFPDEMFITDILEDRASQIRFINLEYFWILEYKVV